MPNVKCLALDCPYNFGEICGSSDITIKPLAIQTEQGDIVIGFGCVLGSEAFYSSMEESNDTSEESSIIL